jgi:hypothetical protein
VQWMQMVSLRKLVQFRTRGIGDVMPLHTLRIALLLAGGSGASSGCSPFAAITAKGSAPDLRACDAGLISGCACEHLRRSRLS